MSKKILIIGNSAKDYALAKKLSEKHSVFVAPESDSIKEFATCLDIREDSNAEILDFVMENDINLTIITSKKALNTDIVDLFSKNNLQIFAPAQASYKFITDKYLMKKCLYKLRIQTPKFGIFEKQNMAQDYIKNLKKPFVIKTNEPSSAIILTSDKSVKTILDSYYAQKNAKVLIEDYIWGVPFSFYAITDGYKALPIGSSIMYKHALEGNGGQLTNGMGACVPNYKLTVENEYFIMDNVVYPILEYAETNYCPYIGILGINGILTEDGSIQILGFEPFMQDSDCSAILNILDTDLYSLIETCIIGSFSDEVDYIPQKDLYATSLVLNCKNKNNNENIIYGIDKLDEDIEISYFPQTKKNKYLEYEANSGSVAVLTAFARTVTSSTNKIYHEVENINFNGISYRKDICKPISTDL